MPALTTGVGHEPGLYELLAALPSKLKPHANHPEESNFLQGMFEEKSLHSLNIFFFQLSEELQDESATREVNELLKLLAKPHLKVRIFLVLKFQCVDCDLFCVTGLIHVGDELKEVNGIPVDDKKPEEIIRILAQSQGAITFKVVPGVKEDVLVKEPKMFVKALFDYDPKDDKAIPCQEAGLAFKKGSILQIMSQDDATWWQAKHEGDANPRAGLIPSKQFQERCEILSTPLVFSGVGFRRSFRLSRKDKKTNKSMYECKKSAIYDTADVPTYEEVTKYQRQDRAKHRLVILVGPTGVGLNELKRKLLISDPQHFSVTIPHTSRPKKNLENDGVEYHFISKHLFETDIQNNKFIEFGEYKGNYYGTSLDSIRSVLSKNKVCLLDVQPHTLKHLRTAEFKPFVVFVKPPTIERLRLTRMNAKVISGKDDKGSAKTFTEDDFQEMLATAQTMENQYGHLFEKVIVNDNLSEAFGELRAALKKVELDTQWVPVSWTHS
uniref:MAGUK p55 scaffold protein 7a n=1 Tax=Hippocampus comes TaxID=109280 RepID=A0A3Q2Z463_HIPCM